MSSPNQIALHKERMKKCCKCDFLNVLYKDGEITFSSCNNNEIPSMCLILNDDVFDYLVDIRAKVRGEQFKYGSAFAPKKKRVRRKASSQ